MISKRQRDALLDAALKCEQAPLIFNKNKEPRPAEEFQARALWKDQQECTFFHQPQAMPWDSHVAVTNDAAILEYFAALGEPAPVFRAAGDREYCFLNPSELQVGIVNAGGPAPGLNVVNDSIVKRHFQVDRDHQKQLGREYKHPRIEVFGYRAGFRGLAIPNRRTATDRVRLIPTNRLIDWAKNQGPEKIVVTDDHALDPVTFLNSSRFNLEENVKNVIAGIKRDKVDVLYVVGGNGTQSGAQFLKAALQKANYRRKVRELVIVGGAKTMDNDLLFADTTFGFTTTVDHLVDAILVFHNTVECTQRVGMMKVFGAASGFVALYAAYCSGVVDYVILPEIVEKAGIWALFDDSQSETVINDAMFGGLELALAKAGGGIKQEEIIAAGILMVLSHAGNELKKRYFVDDKQHALVVVAEGALGVFGQAGAGKQAMSFQEMTGRLQEQLKGVKVSPLEPQYLIRDNPPRSYDIALCKFIGKAMVDAALSGFTDCVVSRWCGRHVLVPMKLATRLTHVIDPRDYFYRTMAARYKTELNEGFVRENWPRVCKENERWLKNNNFRKLLSKND